MPHLRARETEAWRRYLYVLNHSQRRNQKFNLLTLRTFIFQIMQDNFPQRSYLTPLKGKSIGCPRQYCEAICIHHFLSHQVNFSLTSSPNKVNSTFYSRSPKCALPSLIQLLPKQKIVYDECWADNILVKEPFNQIRILIIFYWATHSKILSLLKEKRRIKADKKIRSRKAWNSTCCVVFGPKIIQEVCTWHWTLL